MEQMRIDTRRNNGDGTMEISFSLKGCTPVTALINKEMDIIKLSPPTISEPELTPLNIQYYFHVFRTILVKIQKMKEIQETEGGLIAPLNFFTMFKYTLEDLERYEKMIPKADYSCLEKFLRTIADDQLFELRKTGLKIQQGKSQPLDQVYVMVVIANIFVNEYGQKEFTRNDYVKLFPIFLTSVFYEAIYRYKPSIEKIDMLEGIKTKTNQKIQIK